MKKFPLRNFICVLLVLSMTLIPMACGSDDAAPVVIVDPIIPIDSLIIAINTGSDLVVIDDITFVKDTLFTMPSEPFIYDENKDVLDTEADILYFSERIAGSDLGTFGYSIPVENANYEVRLHFAEMYWGVEDQEGSTGGIGSRVFDVSIEDSVVMDDYDIFADVGPATGTIKIHETTVVDGILDIVLTASVDQPKISALEVIKKAEN